MRTGLASRAFFEDLSFGESLISTYKKDLKFFSDLRRIAKQDAQETVDFSAYEDQIRKLVDRYVMGEKIIDAGQIIDVINLGSKQEPEEWGEEKTREYLERAGFRSVEKRELAHDIQNNWYVVRK